MKVQNKTDYLTGKASDNALLNEDEIRYLLEIPYNSLDAGYIMACANQLTRQACDGKAEVHAQVGMNLSPCPRNCLFCAFAEVNKIFTGKTELPVEEVVALARRAEAEGANALFFMATGDYPFERYIEYSHEVRRTLKPETVMVANVGDFTDRGARDLKDAGYSGIYHAVRLGEGRDTKIKPETRLRTFEVAKDAGLKLGTCVEPVGPEHTVDELLEKIIVGRDANPCYSGAARRISIPGCDLEKFGMINELHMAYIVAVTRLAMGLDIIGNCTHEPNVLGAAAGANLFWAEAGANPRDTNAETSEGRGLGVTVCRKLFAEADFEVLNGPSIIYGSNDSISLDTEITETATVPAPDAEL
ncbi:MAG: radical SAM protein [candidate division Zixibacteria bacterium]|nr:radical SAM protein [candidate division Zixibacteria bacterium]